MRGQLIGSLIAASFGLVYVVVNTGALPGSVAGPLRGLGGAAFLVVLVRAFHAAHHAAVAPHSSVTERPAQHFGRAYWLVVALEAAALLTGVRVLAGPLDMPHAGVAWVSFVVGVHFFALAVVFAERLFHWLGAAITLCGAVGLGLAAAGTGSAAIDVVSGVTPGAILLASAWWGTRRLRHDTQLGSTTSSAAYPGRAEGSSRC